MGKIEPAHGKQKLMEVYVLALRVALARLSSPELAMLAKDSRRGAIRRPIHERDCW